MLDEVVQNPELRRSKMNFGAISKYAMGRSINHDIADFDPLFGQRRSNASHHRTYTGDKLDH
jgi:hypothetical protein